MAILELIKKPIEVVIENNIIDDVIFDTTPVSELSTRISTRLSVPSSKLSEDFLFVLVNNLVEKKIRGVITFDDLKNLVELVVKSKAGETVANLQLEEKFPPKFEVVKSETIEKVLGIFNEKKTDVIIIKADNGTYLGKVKRSKLQSWFNVMNNS